MRIALVAVCIVGFLFVPAMGASAADINAAGLIVDYGDGRVSYAWIPFEEDEISGVQLLERSGLDLVTVGFGGMGDAVCQIDDTGCSVDDCRKRMCQTSDPESPFWRYSRQNDSGEWAFAATGASGARVRDGDIEAWSWTGSEPELPAMTMAELVEFAGADPSILTGADRAPDAAVQTVGGETDVSRNRTSATEGFVGTVVVLSITGLAIWRSRRVTRNPQ